MKEEHAFMSHGVAYLSATLYVYCDKCGSFNIKSYMGLKKWLLIAAACAACGLMALRASAVFRERERFGVFLLCLVVCSVAIKALWGDTDYKCRRCGAVPATRYNMLDYPSDAGIVDVPEQLTQKRYLGYWSDDVDIDAWLKRPRPC